MCVYPFVSMYSDLVFKFDFKFKIKYAFFKKKNLNRVGHVKDVRPN